MDTISDRDLALRSMELFLRFHAPVLNDPTCKHHAEYVVSLQRLAAMAEGKGSMKRDHTNSTTAAK